MFRLAKTFLLHHLTFAGKWHICFCLNSTVCLWRADTNQTKNKSSSPFYPSPPVYSVVAASLLRWYFVLRSKCSFTDFHISSDYLQYFWNQPSGKIVFSVQFTFSIEHNSRQWWKSKGFESVPTEERSICLNKQIQIQRNVYQKIKNLQTRKFQMHFFALKIFSRTGKIWR